MQPTQLIIIGITGDLARRKLLPAIATIAEAGELPPDFKIIGITRQPITAGAVIGGVHGLSEHRARFLRKHLVMHRMNLEKVADYTALDATLTKLTTQPGTQRLYYLSIPPQFAQPVVMRLGESGLAKVPHTKLLLEKPFGTDLISAEELIAQTKAHFTESQLYRIDHYLAKEMAQNIVAFRANNPLFNHTWNNQFIEKIEIIASESIGIEGRIAFYEQTGALRDFVQSHLLQLAALTLMDVPKQWNDLRAARLAALQALEPPREIDLPHVVVRGQYQGYAEETENPGSATETFVALTLFSSDPKWQNVPVQLISGKALAHKQTEIRVHYKRFGTAEPNSITLRIQPKESIEVQMWVKKPGYGNHIERLPLHFTYSDHYQALPEAYERVLLDAMQSDHTLFASSDEVLASWRILAPVQRYWQMQNVPLKIYKKGATIEDILSS